MNARVRWLKASFIAGAVADGIVGVMMLIPSRMGETTFTYPMGLGASLMFGWTLLLVWGYREPVARKGVLLITTITILGLLATGLYQFATGTFPWTKVLPTTVLGFTLIVLMGFSYVNAWTLRE